MADSTIDHFKCEVRRFDTIDTEIRTINEKMKPLQSRLKELKQTKKIRKYNLFMETNEIAECKLSEEHYYLKNPKM